LQSKSRNVVLWCCRGWLPDRPKDAQKDVPKVDPEDQPAAPVFPEDSTVSSDYVNALDVSNQSEVCHCRDHRGSESFSLLQQTKHAFTVCFNSSGDAFTRFRSHRGIPCRLAEHQGNAWGRCVKLHFLLSMINRQETFAYEFCTTMSLPIPVFCTAVHPHASATHVAVFRFRMKTHALHALRLPSSF
jgi:hypothetical protein